MRISSQALDSILGMKLRRAHGAVQRHFGEHFADLGLTQKQVSVLWLTGDNPALAQTDLAQALDMDRATTMALVHGLEKRGLMVRSPAASDKRRIAFTLTDEGVAVLDQAKTAIAQHEQWLKYRFNASELKTLEEMLTRIYR